MNHPEVRETKVGHDTRERNVKEHDKVSLKFKEEKLKLEKDKTFEQGNKNVTCKEMEHIYREIMETNLWLRTKGNSIDTINIGIYLDVAMALRYT